jgi:hypothetical protein
LLFFHSTESPGKTRSVFTPPYFKPSIFVNSLYLTLDF